MTDRERLLNMLEQAPGQANSEIYSMDEIVDYLIANGVTFRKWIPVTEQLPDDDVQVLACTKKGKPFPAHCEDGKWRVSHSVTITHWMPLPEPPKEER